MIRKNKLSKVTRFKEARNDDIYDSNNGSDYAEYTDQSEMELGPAEDFEDEEKELSEKDKKRVMKDLGREFDNLFKLSDAAAQKVIDETSSDGAPDWAAILDAAMAGDNDAKLLLINMCKSRLLSVFWKNFINLQFASAEAIWRRIEDNDEFSEYCSLVLVAFDKAAKAYNHGKLGDKDFLSGFQYYFGQYAMKEAIMYNKHNMAADNAVHADGIGHSAKSNVEGWDRIASSEEDATEMAEFSAFDDSWKQLCKDPRIKGKKQPINLIIADMLGGMDVQALAEKYDVSKNTIRQSILQGVFKDLLDDYDISYEDLTSALKRDDLKYISMLKRA